MWYFDSWKIRHNYVKCFLPEFNSKNKEHRAVKNVILRNGKYGNYYIFRDPGPYKSIVSISSAQSLRGVQLFVIPWTAALPGLPVHHQLLESTQTHLHWFGYTIQPSHPRLSPSPAFNLSQHQSVFHWISSSHKVAKVLELQLQRQSFQWLFRTDFL